MHRYEISQTCTGMCDIFDGVTLYIYWLACSFALTFQVLGKNAQAIPVNVMSSLSYLGMLTFTTKRVFLVLAGTVVYVILAIVGASHFQSWLDTLLVILSVRIRSIP
jgi:hypothetical protein